MKKNKKKDESLKKLKEEIHNDEILFLNKALKKIEKQINNPNYKDINKQKKLWDLREHILKEIDKFFNIYVMIYKKQYKEKKDNLKK